jgi:hypothetical protein
MSFHISANPPFFCLKKREGEPGGTVGAEEFILTKAQLVTIAGTMEANAVELA